MTWKWGNVPVPAQHLVALILGVILQLLFPLALFANSWMGDLLGLLLIALGIGLAIWSVLAAGKVDIESPQQLITNGPYARSRNPMMVAWTVIYLGIALIINSLWIIFLLLPVILYTHFVDIRAEERFLSENFGDQYDSYRERVCRYL